ncbi:PREDICTED: DNA polymerase epsilon subunit 3-like [Priapulus caudatus]|uniref:DNA polymerase epsilon subunit 3 n=1 Tax=Priapulus caudatus TaxID=37621 RepID=A0ABM1DY00_PRICU|nr:PREDICTED: DNA polymerase epsilon subunit 3-like [Priapulus caudatus]
MTCQATFASLIHVLTSCFVIFQLPDGINVSKEAKQALGKAASIFVLYCTSCANNNALKSKRKTLTGQDVFSALDEMEFDHFIPELKTTLEAHKRDQKSKKESAAHKKKRREEEEEEESSSARLEACLDEDIEEVIDDSSPEIEEIEEEGVEENGDIEYIDQEEQIIDPHAGTSDDPIPIDLEDGMNGEDEEAES